ncbi:rRNA maturation RNase YbeY [Mariprofundus erugo]|uniref:rRNA maturation RNase YbeY n=1 Tax=Mariprofundus erugo TaxID=2528639 RepID=UPI001EE8B83C|nr:rRNA maturation RNase YbeY [Mariprofundus erugo]
MPMRMMIVIDVMVDEEIEGEFTPPETIAAAVMAACTVTDPDTAEPDVCVRFAPDLEIRELNSQWRGKDAVTDVLSFPMQEPDAIDFEESLGDIALAIPFVLQEAERLALTPEAHIQHLVVHATLHLLGYDHIDDDEAVIMQQLERQAMQQLGLHDPYPELQA